MRTYLDSRTKINGKLSFEAPAQIDGHVEGEIVAGDHLVIGEGAQVTAKIKAGSVVVAGMVSGEIVATERIEMRASAKMTGNLAAPRLVDPRGCDVRGSLRNEAGRVPRGARAESASKRRAGRSAGSGPELRALHSSIRRQLTK